MDEKIMSDREKVNALIEAQQKAQQKKALNNAIAGIANSFANRNSYGNFYLGKMNQKRDAGKVWRDAPIDDPMAQAKQRNEMMAKLSKDRQLKDMADPNSEMSLKRAKMYEKIMPGIGSKFAGLSAQQQKEMFPALAAQMNKMSDREYQEGRDDKKFQNQLTLAQVKAAGKKKNDKSFQLTDAQKKYWKDKGVSDEQIQMAESGLAGRNPLNALNSIAEKDELGTADIKVIREIDDSLDSLNKIANDFKKDKDLVGIFDGMVPGKLSSDKTNLFRSRLGKFNDMYRKAITGTGASEKEIKMLMANLPAASDTEAAFKGKLKGAIDDLTDRKTNYLRTLQLAGKNTSSFDSAGKSNFDIDGSGDPFNNKAHAGDGPQIKVMGGRMYKKVKGGWAPL